LSSKYLSIEWVSGISPVGNFAAKTQGGAELGGHPRAGSPGSRWQRRGFLRRTGALM